MKLGINLQCLMISMGSEFMHELETVGPKERKRMPSNLIRSMRESTFVVTDGGFGDTLIDFAEVGLDSILEEGLVRDIPIFGTIASLCKVGVNIRERNLVKQTAVFLAKFNDGTISPEKLEEHRKALEEDPVRAEKEMGRVLLILNNTIEERQSACLASLYRGYVLGALSWEKFCELAEVNSRMFIDDYDLLVQLCDKPILQGSKVSDTIALRLRRLESLGLVLENRTRLYGTTLVEPSGDVRFEATRLGRSFMVFTRRKR